MAGQRVETVSFNASDLEKHPVFASRRNNEAPVTTGLKYLGTESGKALELMTVVDNQSFVNAVRIGYIYKDVYGSKFVAGLVEQLERLAPAKEGNARNQMIGMVEAGGNLPAEYYGADGKRSFNPIGFARDTGGQND